MTSSSIALVCEPAPAVPHQLPQHQPLSGTLLEKVIIGNDLSGLTPLEKVQYVTSVCNTLGLNPVTKPIQLLKFQGKEVPYFTKDATEQLRKINRVSITKLETKILDGGVYVVTAYAATPDGRQDSSTGAISVAGFKGDALSNALMKAETKAKRRVTLSISGLGFMDESEADSIKDAVKVDVVADQSRAEDMQNILELHLLNISQARTLDELQEVFKEGYKYFLAQHAKEALEKLIAAKDMRKETLGNAEWAKDYDTTKPIEEVK